MSERQSGADWDRYWQGTWEAAAHQDGGPQDRALEAHWRQFFCGREPSGNYRRLLDVAAGNGAVQRYCEQLKIPIAQRFALDYSVSALRNLQQRYPAVACIAADGARPPFREGLFDLVVSQFGIEYAGPVAMEQAGRLLAPGGRMALVLHLHEGAIYRECLRNRQVLEELKSMNLPGLARAAFQAGYALNTGRATADQFRRAERAFTPAVRSLEQLLQREGRSIAGGLPQQLYTDIARMYRRISAYAEEEVLAWLDGLLPELDAYIGRMQSMVDAALGENDFAALCDQLDASGLRQLQADKLRISGRNEEAAWVYVGERC